MSISLAEVAKEKAIKYFLISYTDLFGSQRDVSDVPGGFLRRLSCDTRAILIAFGGICHGSCGRVHRMG